MRKTSACSGNILTPRCRLPIPAAAVPVISFVVTAGNYEYAVYWYFYQDGTIEFEVKLQVSS